LCALVVSGSQSASVSGRVVNARTQAPVADARVVFATVTPAGDVIDSTVRTTQTDADGRFEFPVSGYGPHILAVTTVGYLYVRRQIDVDATSRIDVVIPLAEGAGTYEENVTVTADQVREDPAVTARTLGPAELQELRGVVTDDPMRAVQALPGVATGDDFQAGFSVRGSPFRHTGVTIDGVPAASLLHVVRADANSGSVSMINTDIVSGAELMVGARPARDGDWLGPTLAFDLREGSRDRTGGRIALSGTSASTVLEGPIGQTRRGSWLVSVRKSYLDWLVRRVEADFDSTIGFWDGHVKAVVDVNERHSFDLTIIGGDAEYQERDASSANGLSRAHSGSTLAMLRWQHRAARSLQNHRVFFLGSEFQNLGSRQQELARGYTQQIGWQGDVTTPAGRGWVVGAGGAIDRTQAGQTARRFRFDEPDRFVDTAVRANGFLATTGAAWLEARRLTSRGSVAVGARAMSRSGFDRPFWSPWVAVGHRVGRSTLRVAAGGTTQLPEPLTVLREQEIARPERAASFDAGVAYDLTPTVTWSVDTFVRREWNILRSEADRVDPMTNAPVFSPVFPIARPTIDGRVRGVDVIVRRHAPARLAGWVGYTWAHARMHDLETGERFDGDYDQRHTLNVVVSGRLSYRSALGLKFRAGSNTPLVGYFESSAQGLRLSAFSNRVRLPTYARLDARATRTFTFSRRRLTLFVEVMNVLDRENVGPADPSVRTSLQVTGFAERLIPRVPSAGFVVEF
jgi:hypothetical protein